LTWFELIWFTLTWFELLWFTLTSSFNRFQFTLSWFDLVGFGSGLDPEVDISDDEEEEEDIITLPLGNEVIE